MRRTPPSIAIKSYRSQIKKYVRSKRSNNPGSKSADIEIRLKILKRLHFLRSLLVKVLLRGKLALILRLIDGYAGLRKSAVTILLLHMRYLTLLLDRHLSLHARLDLLRLHLRLHRLGRGLHRANVHHLVLLSLLNKGSVVVKKDTI